MANRKLEVVAYREFCTEHRIEPGGVQRLAYNGLPCVLLGPDTLQYVELILDYKFGKVPEYYDNDGALLIWNNKDKHDRDRCYILCSYLLRGSVPELWASISG